MKLFSVSSIISPGLRSLWNFPPRESNTTLSEAAQWVFPILPMHSGLIASGSRSSVGTRFIVIVDEDIDPCNIDEVTWALASRCDPERDIEVIREGWSGAIDPLISSEQSARSDFTTGKVILNACRPLYRRESFPAVCAVSPELKAEVMRKWPNIIK